MMDVAEPVRIKQGKPKFSIMKKLIQTYIPEGEGTSCCIVDTWIETATANQCMGRLHE